MDIFLSFIYPALEGLRLHSTVVKRGSPDLSWESWDQTELEYEDEKVLERRRQLLQRELELQMRREETEEHHTRHRHTTTKPKKGLSSSSSTSVSSTSSESSSSSDESSSDSSSSGIAGDNSKRRSKPNKTKRGSTSSVSDTERNKIRAPLAWFGLVIRILNFRVRMVLHIVHVVILVV
ncbi:hypothetical protein J6590_071820 [Homalodisca vitripennis]|nr:hypothetical protein J6590_071820 [Homalodisca vitripennis]